MMANVVIFSENFRNRNIYMNISTISHQIDVILDSSINDVRNQEEDIMFGSKDCLRKIFMLGKLIILLRDWLLSVSHKTNCVETF